MDLGCQGVGVCVCSIKIFATDRNTYDPIMAILLNGSEQRCFFGIEMICIFSPDANKKCGASRNGSGDRVGKGVTV